jgi:hypothetical protein
MIFAKYAKNTQCRKDSFFNKWCWKNQVPIYRIMKLVPYLTLYKNQIKWTHELNIRTENVKTTRRKHRGKVS